jgi:LysM repeat protein
MTLAEIRQLNKLRVDKVSVGTKLAVAAPEPGNKPAAGSRVAETESRQSVARGERAAPRTHTVQKGETLARLAQRYDLSVSDLKRLNKLRGEHLAPGSKLVVAEPEPARTPAARKRVELAELDRKHEKDDDDQEKKVKGKHDKKDDRKKDKASAESAKPDARKRPRLAQYTIRRGDTLVSIAKQFRVEKDDLLRWNRIPASAIKPGQTLTIQLVQSNL